MSEPTKICSTTGGCGKVKAFFLGIVIVAALLIVGVLIQAVIHYTTPTPIGQDRAAFRAKNLAELRAANAEALTTYGYADQQRGIVRLPIEQAMNLIVTEWQEPQKGRALLLERQALASKPLPKAPEKPSAYE